MKILGDICFPLSKYHDQQTNEEKTRWGRCGTLMQNAEGNYRIKLDMVPVNMDEGWFAVFERDNKPAASKPKPQTKPAPSEDQEDIPF